jgi:hypothetical protein
MPYNMKPLSCDPARVKGMSERLIISHYENNYGGAVKRLNLIDEQLAQLEFDKAAGFLINGLKREQLIAMNSMVLHNSSLTDWASKVNRGEPCTKQLSEILNHLNVGVQSSSRWERRSAVVRDGCCCRGRHAIASSSTSGRPTIATRWLAARRSWRSICTSTPITWISAPKSRVTLIALWE